MEIMLKFLIQHKNYVIIISIAVFVLCEVVTFYETSQLNMVHEKNEMIDNHHNEIHMLNHEIYIREMDIVEITDQYSALHTELAATQDEVTYANSNHQALQQQFDDLHRRYWEMRGSHDFGEWMRLFDINAPLISHITADPDKIDMIVRHFNAMYSGDLDAYLSTLMGGCSWEYPGVDPESDWSGEWTWTDWMLRTYRSVAEREYYRMEVKFIPDWWHHNPERERTAGYMSVWILVQETPNSEPFLRSYSLGVSSRGGANFDEWRIYDYH